MRNDQSVRHLPAALLAGGLLLAAGCAPAPAPPAPPPAGEAAPQLLTWAEERAWEGLTPHEEVVAFYRRLTALSPDVRMREIGRSREGRPLHLVILSRPSVASPQEAHASGRPILFIGAQVHGDEPAGKEGLMLFARDLALGPLQDLLEEVVFVFVPQINPDGAEAGSWGTRSNAAGYNLNRDYARLVNPETSALVEEGVVPWRPHVIVDAHELPGPPRIYDFYTLHPRNLNGPSRVVDLARDGAVPAIEAALAAEGYDHIVYHRVPGGLLENPERGLLIGGTGARTFSTYGGAQGAVTLLFESLRERDARIGIGERAGLHRIAMEALARWTAANATRVVGAVDDGRREMARLGGRWDPADRIAIDFETVERTRVDYRLGATERDEEGRLVVREVHELRVPLLDSVVVTQSRPRPVGYLIAPHRRDLAEQLARHGIVVERLRAAGEARVESFRVDSVQTAAGVYEGYVPARVRTSTVAGTLSLPAGTFLVRTDQVRAGLIFELLEPEREDSFASEGRFRSEARPGRILPVHRLRELPGVPVETVTFR